MKFPPIYTVQNYNEMLAKISLYCFLYVYLMTFFLRKSEQIDTALKSIEVPFFDQLLEFGGFNLSANVGGALIAAVCAFLSRTIKLHDTISDLLGIRARYDVNYILVPLIKGSSKNQLCINKKNIYEKRRDLMKNLFYRYFSSTKPDARVDTHDIHHVLTEWSWYWICVESIFFLVIASFIALYFQGLHYFVYWASAAFVLFFISFLFYFRCARYTKTEVRDLLYNEAIRQEICESAHAILGSSQSSNSQ